MRSKIDKYDDLVLGILFLVISVLYYVGAARLPSSKLFAVGADFVPKIYGAGLFILSIAFILFGTKKVKTHRPEAPVEEEFPVEYDRVLRVSTVFALYILLFNFLGFVLSTFIFMLVEMLLFAPDGKRRKKDILLYAVISAIFSVGLYYAFRSGFHVLLPKGILNI